MQVTSIYRFARISAFKAREVTREIQGRSASDALDLLTFSPKKAAALVKKTLRSAIANAENNAELKVDTLRVKEAVVGEGPTFKRFRAPRARHVSKAAGNETERPKKQKKTTSAGAATAEVKQTGVAQKTPKPVKPVETATETKSREEKE